MENLLGQSPGKIQETTAVLSRPLVVAARTCLGFSHKLNSYVTGREQVGAIVRPILTVLMLVLTGWPRVSWMNPTVGVAIWKYDAVRQYDRINPTKKLM